MSPWRRFKIWRMQRRLRKIRERIHAQKRPR